MQVRSPPFCDPWFLIAQADAGEAIAEADDSNQPLRGTFDLARLDFSTFPTNTPAFFRAMEPNPVR
ncbi:MAG: hypothetical protein ACYDC1_19060 [Limisphaerales bacterium]